MSKANVDNKNDKAPPADMEVGESSSASSLEKEVRQTQLSGDNKKSPLNDASFNAISLGFSKPIPDNAPRQVGEEFISGNSNVKVPSSVEENSHEGHVLNKNLRNKIPVHLKGPSPSRNQAEEDVIQMGFTKQDFHFTSPLGGDSDNDFLGQQLPDDNWDERVNSLNSHKPNDDCPITINPKEDTGKSSKKGKRYGSLANLQDKVISSFERKRRDRGWRKIKKGGVDITSSELEGRSLSDSDLRTRRDFQIKEARKTLEVGNELGVKFLGPAQDVINDICSLEEVDFIARQK
ncbi:hypothetical protein V6N13_064500 [Hibiscus sabdariffa]